MLRACVFCGERPTTREHVWPGWLRRKLDIRENLPHTHLFEAGGELIEELGWEAEPYKLVANAVCGRCSGGWMSTLEQRAQALLEAMIEGRGRELHRDGQRRLAGWALLKAMMFDQASRAEARGIFPSYYAHLFEHGYPPPEARVWISSYSGEIVSFTSFAAAEVSADGQEVTGRQNVFVRTFSIGP